MRRVAIAPIIAVMSLAVAASPLRAQQLAYGGDPYPTGGYSSYVNAPGPQRIDNIMFDNFVVPVGSIWDISGVFGNVNFESLDQDPTTMYWQIRSGMSAGSGAGTLLHTGSGSFTGSLPMLSLDIAPIALDAGEYWLGLYFDLSSPVITSPDINKLTGVRYTTTDANAQNWPNDNRALWLIGEEGGPDPQIVVEVDYDMSIGVLGTSRVAVPEPGTLGLLAAGITALAALRRRARTSVV